MKNFGIPVFVVLAVGFVLYVVGHGNFTMAMLFVAGLAACKLMTVRHNLIYWALFAGFSRLTLPVSVLRSLTIALLIQAIYVAGEILYRSLNRKTRQHWRDSDYMLLSFVLMLALTAKVRGFGIYALGGSSIGGVQYIEIAIQILFMLSAGIAVRTQSLDIHKCYRYILAGAALCAGASVVVSIFPSGYGAAARFFKFPQIDLVNDAGMMGRISSLGNLACALMPFVLTRKKFISRVVLALGCVVLAALSGFRTWMIAVAGLYLMAELYLYRLNLNKVFAGVAGGLLLLGVVWVVAPTLDIRFQRSLSVIPGFETRILPEALDAALNSTDWRKQVYELCIQNVPNYLFVGRGLASSIGETLNWLGSARLHGGEAFYHYDAHSYHLAIFALLIDYGSVATILFFGAMLTTVCRMKTVRNAYPLGYEAFTGSLFLFSIVATLTFWSGFSGTALELLMVGYILCNSISAQSNDFAGNDNAGIKTNGQRISISSGRGAVE